MLGMGNRGGGKIFAVADIGSGSASVAIVETGKNGPAHILAVESVVLPIEKRGEDATAAAIITGLSESATKVLASASKGHLGRVAGVYAIIHAPWITSMALRGIQKFEREEKITDQTIAALAKEALANDTTIDRSKLLEASVVRVELNGYPTAKPVGKHAHAVVVSVLGSECEPGLKNGVEEALTRSFSIKPTLRSSTRALLSVMRERAASHMDYMLVHMTPGATSLISVHKGMPFQQAMVPEGTNTILQRVAGKGMPEETKALMRMLARDHCEDAACEEVRVGMARAEQDLIKIFGEAIGKMAAPRKLPNAVLLVAEPWLAEWLATFLARIDFTQFTITTQPFSVEFLHAEDIGSLVAISKAPKEMSMDILVDVALVNSELQNRD